MQYARERRSQALADLQAQAIAAVTPVFEPIPEELIRQDRAQGALLDTGWCGRPVRF